MIAPATASEPRLLVTRPAADAAPLIAALARQGCRAASEPLLEIVDIPGPSVDVAGVQALLVTSANGVRAFAARNPERDLRVLAVGDASATAARALGFARTESASGDVAALAELCKRRLDPAGGPLLHVAGTRIAGDLAGELERAGFRYRREVLYQAREASRLSQATLAALSQGELDGVLFFSPRTAQSFVALAARAGATAHLARVTAFCLSEAVATKARAASWRRIVVAERPEQDSLLAAIARFGGA
jgi:uroporphyrinogen-III synthase